MQLRPIEKQDTRLLIVKATEDELQKYEKESNNSSPLSDKKLNQLIEKLEEHQPKIVGINILRDRRINNQDNLIYICNHPGEKQLGQRYPGYPAPQEVQFDRAGFSNVIEDSDGIVRRHLLFEKPEVTSPCQSSLSFSFLLAAYYLKAQEGIEAETNLDGNTKFNNVIFKKLKANSWAFRSSNFNNSGIYTEDELGGYQILLNYRYTKTKEKRIAPTVSFSDVLEGKIRPNAIKNKIVIVGYNTEGHNSFFSNTPYTKSSYKKIPALELQAQMVSQIISSVLDKRALLSFLPKWGEYLWLWSWILIGTSTAWIFHERWSLLILTNSTAIIILFLFYWGSFIYGFWLPLVRTILFLFLASSTTIIVTNYSLLKILVINYLS